MALFKSEAMSDTNIREREGEVLPKGRVNEVCREWLVREDGAFAYRLQNQEINEHLSGNKFRNAVVREDFPRAKNEQMREQQLAEQTAMIYHQMLAEQEEHDQLVAKQLADDLEREERQKRRAVEVHDQDLARHILERERMKVERHHAIPHTLNPQRPPPPRGFDSHPSPHRPDPQNYQANLPRRQAKAMPLPHPSESNNLDRIDVIDDSARKFKELELARKYPKPANIPQFQDAYSEPYKNPDILADNIKGIDLQDVGLPVDEFFERQLQEEKDAELARQLQEAEGTPEDTLLNRDRMLAIEAQDKELAKLLQERERGKARRARERAKQKALAKKQQLQQLEAQQGNGSNQLLPDDSYAYPADLIPPRNSIPRHPEVYDTYSLPHQEDNLNNYSLPVDVLPVHSFNSQKYGNRTNGADNIRVPLYDHERGENLPPIRPTQLDLRSPLNRINKPRYPEPDLCETTSCPSSASSPSQHVNIAMVIDPTYTRRGGLQSSSSFETTSSTVTTSTSSSSPGMVLPPPDIAELDDETVVPPYMPIQGQRRTGSLEKKSKKKNKEGGCKQQ